MGAVVIKAWREIRGKLGVCDRSVTGGVSRKLRRWGEWGILIHFWQGASSSGMLGRLCCVNFRLPGVGFCRSGVRYRRLGVRCPLPVRVSSLNLSALRARNFRLNGDWDACAAGNFTCRAGEHLSALLPFGYGISPSGEDGTPVRRAARWGRLWGCAPFAAPLASPPEHPPKRGHQHPLCCEGTRLKLRELPSLAALAQAISLRAA